MTEFLKSHISEIIEVNEKEFQIISDSFTPIKIRKRQFLIQENQLVNTIYLVKKGLLKSSLMTIPARSIFFSLLLKIGGFQILPHFLKKKNLPLPWKLLKM